jgi:phosphohistidine phosphatase
MKIILFRHGIAVDRKTGGAKNDFQRPLTADGAAKTRAAAHGLAAIGCSPDAVVASPLIRAVETARIVAETILAPHPIQQCELLSPNSDLKRLAAWLRDLSRKRVLLVGHMPDLAEFAGFLIASRADAGIRLKKAGAARIDCAHGIAAGAGELQWLLAPSHLRALGER